MLVIQSVAVTTFCSLISGGLGRTKRSEANQTNKPLMHISRKQDLRSMKTLLESVLITAAAGTEPVENPIVRCKR
jgi:hypothetical protein